MELKAFIEKFVESIEVDDQDMLSGATTFRDLDEWSSLSVMLLIAFFDEEFEKEIGEKEIKNCATIEDLYNMAIA